MTSKQLLLFVLAIASLKSSYGQTYIGLSGGPAFTKFSVSERNETYLLGNSEYDFKHFTGYSFSVPIVYKLNIHSSLQSGLAFQSIGSKYILDANDLYVMNLADPIYQYLRANNGIIESERLQYLSLPITFKYTVPIGNFGFYGRAGGYLSYMLGKKQTNEQNLYAKEYFTSKSISHMDAGLLLGLGGQMNVGKDYIFAEAMYLAGLTNNKVMYPFYSKTYNRGMTINVGYMISLKK